MSMSSPFGPFALGPAEPVLVIAEVGVNHNGLRDIGMRQLRAAIAAGAHAVKFQSFRAEEIATTFTPKVEYQSSARGESQLEMLRHLELSPEDFAEYRAEAARLGAVAFSTPFDPESVGQLAAAGVELMKIASGELTNEPLIEAVARTHLPTIISTGMATMEEVASAVALHVRSAGGPLALLHCVSSYPAPLEQLNLRAIASLREHFRVPVGLSDHTIGRDAAVAAVALGADIVEKHFTVDRTLPGPDHAMSMEPEDFSEMLGVLSKLRRGMGTGVKSPVASEIETLALIRRSIVAARDLSAGTVLSSKDLALKRPAGGLAPSALHKIIGRRIRRDIRSDEQIRAEDMS